METKNDKFIKIYLDPDTNKKRGNLVFINTPQSVVNFVTRTGQNSDKFEVKPCTVKLGPQDLKPLENVLSLYPEEYSEMICQAFITSCILRELLKMKKFRPGISKRYYTAAQIEEGLKTFSKMNKNNVMKIGDFLFNYPRVDYINKLVRNQGMGCAEVNILFTNGITNKYLKKTILEYFHLVNAFNLKVFTKESNFHSYRSDVNYFVKEFGKFNIVDCDELDDTVSPNLN